jgi:hypothetical protein
MASTFLSHTIDQAPKIIREAARSPLGLLALVVLTLAVLAFLLFHDASELVRLGIFCVLLIGAALFSAKAFQIASAERTLAHGAGPNTDERTHESEAHRGQPRVIARRERDAPFEVDAVVVEDDTYMVLSSDPTFEIAHGSLNREVSRAANAEALELGCVVVKPGRPTRFLAVVHDLSKEPTWTEASIQRALTNVLHEAEHRKLKAIAVPPLGTKHGSLAIDRFIELLGIAFSGMNIRHVENVWFVLPDGLSSAALTTYAQLVTKNFG